MRLALNPLILSQCPYWDNHLGVYNIHQYTSIYINIPTTPHALEAKFSIWKPVQPRNLLVQLHWTIALDML